MFVDDVRDDPWSYPGTTASTSGMLVDHRFQAGAEPDLIGRTPVLAVGSNASPSQIYRKLVRLPEPVVVPFSVVTAYNLVAGVSAHVSQAGYVPATPVAWPGRSSQLVVIWLDMSQVEVIDATEPNYDRLPLPSDRYPVVVDGQSVPLQAYEAYVGRHGCLIDEDGSLRLLTSQRDLIASLLRQSSALEELAGSTPEEFVATMRADTRARDRARQVLVAEGLVSDPGP
jgi:hypothetical protein